MKVIGRTTLSLVASDTARSEEIVHGRIGLVAERSTVRIGRLDRENIIRNILLLSFVYLRVLVIAIQVVLLLDLLHDGDRGRSWSRS